MRKGVLLHKGLVWQKIHQTEGKSVGLAMNTTLFVQSTHLCDQSTYIFFAN